MLNLFLGFWLFAFAQGQYDFSVGKRNCLLSYAAYCGTNVQSNWTCFWCQQVPGVQWVGNFGDSASATFGYVVIVDNSITVTWRGTDNLPGWIKDANFKKIEYPGVPNAQVHQGFYTGIRSQQAAIENLLRKAFARCPSCKLVYFTGHSLGGALATLSALQTKGSNPNLSIRLYTYGSPRVGNQAFSTWATKQFPVSWRMTNMRDPVPHLPLKLMGYYHLSREIWRELNGTYHNCDPRTGEDPNCIDKVIIQNPIDHGTYMGINILTGIPRGCLWVDP